MKRVLCSLVILASTPALAQQTLSPIQQYLQGESGYAPQAYAPPAPQPYPQQVQQPYPQQVQQQQPAAPQGGMVQQYLRAESGGYAPPAQQQQAAPQPNYPYNTAYEPAQPAYQPAPNYAAAPRPTNNGNMMSSGVSGMNNY